MALPRNPENDISLEEAQSLFYYREGVLYWAVDRKSNKVKDQPVGNLSPHGYFETKVNNKSVKVHRIIFLLAHGYLPENVDHIDGNRSNNHIENLRAATMAQNKYNQKLYKSNKSGVKGVYWDKYNHKWAAQISHNKKVHYLGTFDDINEAAKVVDMARQKLHKEFARAA